MRLTLQRTAVRLLVDAFSPPSGKRFFLFALLFSISARRWTLSPSSRAERRGVSAGLWTGEQELIPTHSSRGRIWPAQHLDLHGPSPGKSLAHEAVAQRAVRPVKARAHAGAGRTLEALR